MVEQDTLQDAMLIPASDEKIFGSFIEIDKINERSEAGCSGACRSGHCMAVE